MNSVTHLGLDVHKETIAVGILRPDGVEPDVRNIRNTPEALRKLVTPMDRASLFACYEAGPTGYDTYRVLERLGVRCEVIAPRRTGPADQERTPRRQKPRRHQRSPTNSPASPGNEARLYGARHSIREPPARWEESAAEVAAVGETLSLEE